ncbi:MAG: zinc-binding dehydrogenase [Myxococcaceae bacterium]|nr:zinc-binding dehydrogenase [Myxococcaceae bacterium]MCI0672792.1 zinc-binding dehydrogenase [Myxococcaceae bacterium]
MPHACFITRSGGPEVLAVREVPRQPCGPEQVRVAVAFCGANFADLAARAGVYGPAPRPPFVPGFEVSGTVEEAGPRSGFSPGERVLAVSRFGGYVDELVADAARVRRLPEGMSLEEGAALPAQYLTAHHALTRVAHAQRGESVLIHAVAGGVGTAALQLSRAFGLVTYGTASSEEKLAFARTHGLDHGIDYARQDFEVEVRRLTEGRGVDVALDANGGPSFGRSFRCLAPGGRLVVYGAAAALPQSLTPRAIAQWPRVAAALARQKWFHPFELIARNVSVCGLQLLLLWDDVEGLGQQLDALLALYREGRVRPVVERVFPLAEAAQAHRALHSRRTRGKVLLRAREETPW